MELNKRYARSTQEQLRYYVQFARSHPELRQNNNCPKLWQEIASKLNAMDGPKRTAESWRQSLRNWRKQLHSRVRKHEMRNFTQNVTTKLSEFDEQTLEVFSLPAPTKVKVQLPTLRPRAEKRKAEFKYSPKSERKPRVKPQCATVATGTTDDATDAWKLGQLWASKYRNLPPDQQLFARTAIGEIFEDAKMGKLRSVNEEGERMVIRNDSFCSTTSSELRSVFAAEPEPPINKRQLLRSYIGLLLDDNIPIDILDSPNMRNLIEPLCTTLNAPLQLNAANCRHALSLVATKVRQAAMLQLQQRLISLKIDSLHSDDSDNNNDAATNTRTPPQNNLFALSAQFIEVDQLETRVLGVLEINAAGSLQQNLLNTLQKYQIDYDQVATISVDSGAASAASAAANAPNNVIVERIEVQRYAAHRAQVCALALQQDAEIREHIKNCRKLTQYVHKSASSIFAILGRSMPQLDCATRWGTTYSMIEALVAARDILTVKMQPEDDDDDADAVEVDADVSPPSALLTPTFWAFCDAFLCILGPLQKTLRKFEAEPLHTGNFYAQWLKCKIQTQRLLASTNVQDVRHKLGRCLLAGIERATAQLLSNARFCACLFLDPRFHNTLKAAQKTQSIRYLQALWTKVSASNARNAAAAACAAGVDASAADSAAVAAAAVDPLVENEFSDDEDALLNEFLSKEVQHSVCADATLMKIEQLQLPFVRSDANVLQFWLEKQHAEPELFALSNICFAIPTAQVTLEHELPTLKSALKHKRNGLSVNTLDDLLMVQLHPSVLDEAIETSQLFHEQTEAMSAEYIKFEIIDEQSAEELDAESENASSEF